MKKFLLIILVLFLTGCETIDYEQNQNVVNQFVGKTEDQILMKFGVPKDTYKKDDGGKIFHYLWSGTTSNPETVYNTFTGQWEVVSGTGSFLCGINFHINSSKTVFAASPYGNCQFN